MYIWEVLGTVGVQKNKPKRTKSAPTTDFERNASKLRSKDRKLNLQKPVAPVKHVG